MWGKNTFYVVERDFATQKTWMNVSKMHLFGCFSADIGQFGKVHCFQLDGESLQGCALTASCAHVCLSVSVWAVISRNGSGVFEPCVLCEFILWTQASSSSVFDGSSTFRATGHMTYGSVYRELIVDKLRKAAELCDCLQCFFLIHSLGGGKSQTPPRLATFII